MLNRTLLNGIEKASISFDQSQRTSLKRLFLIFIKSPVFSRQIIKINCVRRRKNALLIQIGVEIVWDNVDSVNEWILGSVSGSPRRFYRADHIITNLAKEIEPGEMERTP